MEHTVPPSDKHTWSRICEKQEGKSNLYTSPVDRTLEHTLLQSHGDKLTKTALWGNCHRTLLIRCIYSNNTESCQSWAQKICKGVPSFYFGVFSFYYSYITGIVNDRNYLRCSWCNKSLEQKVSRAWFQSPLCDLALWLWMHQGSTGGSWLSIALITTVDALSWRLEPISWDLFPNKRFSERIWDMKSGIKDQAIPTFLGRKDRVLESILLLTI